MGSNAYWSNGYGDEDEYDESPPNDDATVSNSRLEDMFECLLEKSEAQDDMLHELSFEIASINEKLVYHSVAIEQLEQQACQIYSLLQQHHDEVVDERPTMPCTKEIVEEASMSGEPMAMVSLIRLATYEDFEMKVPSPKNVQILVRTLLTFTSPPLTHDRKMEKKLGVKFISSRWRKKLNTV